MKRLRFGFSPPLSRLEISVAILAAVPALIAGYLYGLWALGVSQ